MTLSRPITVLAPALTRPLTRRTPLPLRQTVRFASGYGDDSGNDPKASNPQEQGSNPSESLEHPGPPPPEEGQGSGGGPTKGAGGHTSSGGKRESGDERSGSNDGATQDGRTQGAQPKILDERGGPHNVSEEAHQHNKEMSERHDRASNSYEGEETKVDPGYWSGRSGRAGH